MKTKKNHSDKELIIAFIENRLEVVSRHLSLVKVILNEAQYHEDIRNVYFQKVIPPIKESIDRFFEEGTKRGRFRDIDPGAMTMALIGCTAVNALARLTKVFGEDFHYEEKLEETVDIFMNGIANK